MLSMDKLMTLKPVFSFEADSQASVICDLLEKAATEGKSHVEFAAHRMHPLVAHVLTSKGYRIEDITNNVPGTDQKHFGWSPQKTFMISHH